MTYNIKKSANKLLLLLILTDLMFMILDVFHYTGIIKDRHFYIGMDLGYAEFYQYMKEYWIVLLLLIIAYKRKKLIYFSWSLIFLYVLIDDSLKLHERIGLTISEFLEFQPLFGLRAQDFGELSVSILFGTVLFSFLALLYFKSKVEAKKISKNLLVLFFLLVFFGVLVDMIGMILHGEGSLFRHLLNHLIIIIEDGGEMFVMSVIVWYLFKLKPTSDQIKEISLFKDLKFMKVKSVNKNS